MPYWKHYRCILANIIFRAWRSLIIDLPAYPRKSNNSFAPKCRLWEYCMRRIEEIWKHTYRIYTTIIRVHQSKYIVYTCGQHQQRHISRKFIFSMSLIEEKKSIFWFWGVSRQAIHSIIKLFLATLFLPSPIRQTLSWSLLFPSVNTCQHRWETMKVCRQNNATKLTFSSTHSQTLPSSQGSICSNPNIHASIKRQLPEMFSEEN